MKPHTETLEHASVRQYCKLVRVPAISANFVSLAEQAVKEKQSHIRYLEALLQVESEERDRHAIDNRTRDAQLPRMKTLEEFDFAQALFPALTNYGHTRCLSHVGTEGGPKPCSGSLLV